MPFTISFPLSQTHTEGQQTTGLDPDSAQQVCVRYNTSPQFLNKKYEKLCNFLNKVLQYRKLFSWFDFQNKSPGNSIKVDQDSLKFNFFRKEKVSFHQKCTIFKNIAVIYFINLVKFSLFSVLQIERLIKKNNWNIWNAFGVYGNKDSLFWTGEKQNETNFCNYIKQFNLCLNFHLHLRYTVFTLIVIKMVHVHILLLITA